MGGGEGVAGMGREEGREEEGAWMHKGRDDVLFVLRVVVFRGSFG